MFKIGEFSKLTQVSIRMLRYYDETGLLKPAKIDPLTGYRMYSVEQLPLLHRILFLRDTGFSSVEIAQALEFWEQDSIGKHLLMKQKEIELAINQQKEKLRKLNTAVLDLNREKSFEQCNIIMKSVPSYQVLSHRKIIPNYFCEGQLWKELASYMNENGVKINSTENDFAIYHDLDFKESDVDVEVCIHVQQMGKNQGEYTYRNTEAVETMACAMVYGSYQNIGPTYESFAHWLAKHSLYQMTGQSRQICHRGPWNEEDPNRYLVELQIPVTIQP